MRLARGVIVATALYITTVLYSMFLAASRVRELPAGSADAVFGPLVLVHIKKTALTGGGFSLDFSMQIGLLVLLAAAVALGMLFNLAYASKHPS